MKIAIFGQPKSGTTFLFYLLEKSLPDQFQLLFEPARYSRNESNQENKSVLAKILLEKHLSTSSSDYESFLEFDKKLFLVRDPRDWLISAVLFLTQKYPTIYQNQPIIMDTLELLRQKEENPQSLPFSDLVSAILKNTSFKNIHNLISAIEQHYQWLFNFEAQLNNCHQIKYEQLINNQFTSLNHYLNLSLKGSEIEIPEYHNHVIRSCAAENWRHWLTPSDIEFFKPIFKNYLDRYYPEHDWELETKPKIDSQHSTLYVERVINKRRVENNLPTIKFSKTQNPLANNTSKQKPLKSQTHSIQHCYSPNSIPSSSNQFTYQNFKTEQQEQLLIAFTQAFNQIRSPSEWSWTYLQPPCGSRILLACTDNNIAAHYAGIFLQAIYQSQPITIAAIVDTFSGLKYRAAREDGQLVISKTARVFFQQCREQQNVHFFFGFPNQKHFKLGHAKMDYQALDQWAIYQYNVKARPIKSFSLTGRIQQVQQFGPEFDQLWDKNKSLYQFAICRNADFLNWRFIKHPTQNYKIWSYSSFLDEAVNGYLVFKLQHNKAMLMDICFPSHQNEIEWFWAQVTQRLEWEGIDSIETWFASCSPYKNQLLQLGFRESSFVPTLPEIQMMPCCVSDYDMAWCEKHFFFSMADSDLY